MVEYLLGGGEVVAGLGILVAWWVTLRFVARFTGGKQLSAVMFAFVPCVFLLWAVLGGILLLRGLGIGLV